VPRERPEPPPFEPEWLDRSLNRYLAWGLVFMILLLAGFVAYRIREPGLRRDAMRAQTESYTAIGKQLFSANCAQCHGNDGRGKTEMGKSLYPKAPDMTLAETQNLSDGELFAIIRNGVRLTGMPAWGGDGDDADDWKLVHFIRHMPKMSKEEVHAMRKFNPISRADLEEEEFLNGKP